MALPVTITGISTAVAPVGPFKLAAGNYNGLAFNITGANNASVLLSGGSGGFIDAVGQSFTNGASTLTITSIDWTLAKNGSPTDLLYLEITATDVTGTVLYTSNQVSGSTLSTTAGAVNFTFPAPPTISASATFGVVIRRTGAQDTTNRYSCGATSPSVYAGGNASTHFSTTWSTQTYDALITIYQSVSLPDAYYFIGRDGTTATTLQAFKSTAPDTSWSSIATRTGFTTAILNIAGYQVGNVIHLVVQDGTVSTSVATKYLSFDAATDTFLATTETVAAAAATTGQVAGVGASASLVVRSNGDVVTFYNGLQVKVSGTFRAHVYYRIRTGVNTYGTATQVNAATAFDNVAPIAILGAADRVHFVWAAPNSAYRTLSAANALNTAGTSASMVSPGDGVSYDRSGTTKVVVTSNATGQTVMRFDSSDNPTPSFATPTAANATLPHRIGTFPNTDDVTIVYRNSADSDLYSIKSTDDGATFGTAVSFFVGTVASADANVSRSSSGSVYIRGGNNVVGYLVVDGGVLKYNEYSLTTVTNYTMPAVTGMLTLNGPVNKLAYSRDFNADAGVFALAGTDAAMRRGYTLAAVPGSFALSGKTVACHLKRAAVTGSFVLAGQTTVLRYNRIFPAAKGTVTLAGPVTGTVAARFVRSTVTSYTLSGKDATLTWTSVVLHRTMPAVTGALTVNGQAAALKRSYFVPHTTGAVVLGGVAVNLRAIRTMPAVKGTVTLGGVATSLRYGRVTVTTAGTFTLGGVAAGLRYGHVLSAAPGAFILSGQPIVFGYGSARTMTASTGTVTLAGPVTKLAYDRVFPVTAGAFTLAGQASTLRYARVMPAAKGTLTLNGVVTGLLFSHDMVVTEGTVTLTGRPVTLRYTRLMQAVNGTLVVNGSATNLIWSGAGAKTMPASSGAFVLSGKVVTFKQTAVIKATVTAYTLTGTATTLAAGRRLSATPGVFTLSGKAVGFVYGRGMSGGTGAFVLTGKPANLLRLIVNQYFMPAATGEINLTRMQANLSRSDTEQPGRMNFGRTVYLRRW